ncbi:PD-(D/E)XK nuclease family protein [Campylobacter sp. RM16192]|uniref:PD-(D/E)XK nuclease family protein n=1 Tax=Campylobacter sp. RM16192 TaxID=1660080 RepID=UPI001451F0B4|nr:PD-(D/E)XK nuclease family protein [Campylobacter sp. RM16192]QCD51924.1 exonuclease V, helicase AddB [Campylobacter sp. RM16192]
MIDLNRLFVFTNSRKIRDFNSKFEEQLIPKAITIAEFEKKAVLVKDRFEADSVYLLVLMQRASASVKEAREQLKIPDEFFAFLKNNDYLFSFFKELAIQKKSIEDIKFSDIYANFEEHLTILEAVLNRYKELLQKENLYDDIVLPEIYNLNEDYISEFDEIIIEIDGFLSEFEWEILNKVSSLTTLKIIFQTSKFNKKLVDKISQVSGINNFAEYSKFELNLSDKTLKNIGTVNKKREVQTRSFATASLECAYVMAKASEFIRDGIEPEKIAVILPDESFSELLAMHDFNRIFNFAMGESFKNTKFFQTIEYIVTAINDKKRVNLDTQNRFEFNEFEFILDSFGVKNELFNKFKNHFEMSCKFNFFKELINEILSLQDDKNVEDLVFEELFYIENLARYFNFTLRQICEIFLMKLNTLKLDDIGGGKINVIGILESRGMKFDGVIIVDFNDDLIPKRSVNEMFLNSKVREKAGLISYIDRENLQRFYYENLINESKKTAICYLVNEEKIPSRFLNEFIAIKDINFRDDEYAKVLSRVQDGTRLRAFDDEVILRHDFFAMPLSFSKLNTFLTCPRKYYYSKILGIKPALMPQDSQNTSLGNAVHTALCEYYNKFEKFDLVEFEKILSSKEVSPLDFEILMINFEKFAKKEQDRFVQGWRVKACEKELSRSFEGIMLTGFIDRIDKRDGDINLIDYKSGSFDKKSLQLPFYEALVGAKCEAFYYDLKSDMELVKSASSIEDLRIELENLKKINKSEINFSRNVGVACRYCEYKIICKGEL